MPERPLLSRFGKLPTYAVRAMKEAHAVFYAGIASVTWFVLSLTLPLIMGHYHVSFLEPNLTVSLCGAVIIALIGLGIGGYLVWEEEDHQHTGLKNHHAALQERLRPRLQIEFDPQGNRFVCETSLLDHTGIVNIRVLARPLSPVVKNCRAFLKSVSQLADGGEKYDSVFKDPVPIPWSYENPNAILPKELNQSIDSFLDVAWVEEGAFGLLNRRSNIPNQLRDVMQSLVLPQPSRNLKLDLLIIGDDSEPATLSLNIHRGNPQWNKPQVGWMTDQTGNEIHILRGNILTDLTPRGDLV